MGLLCLAGVPGGLLEGDGGGASEEALGHGDGPGKETWWSHGAGWVLVGGKTGTIEQGREAFL